MSMHTERKTRISPSEIKTFVPMVNSTNVSQYNTHIEILSLSVRQ